jgi:chromosomal replication initiator protein
MLRHDNTASLQPQETALASSIDWRRVSERLRVELGDDVYNSWFARLTLDTVVGDTAYLSVPTRFLKSWIQSHYLDRLTAILTADAGVRRVSLSVRTADGRPATPVKQQVMTAEPATVKLAHVAGRLGKEAMEQGEPSLTSSSPVDRKYTFDSFFVGRSNALAHAAAQQVIGASPQSPAPFNPLYIHSAVGLGKTHLAQALVNELEAQGRRVVYLTAERFMFSFVSSLKTQTAMAFKEALRGIDVLVVDDVQFLSGKSIQSEFGHTLNALIESCRQVVIAADRAPSALDNVDERVRSRLAGGLVVEMGALDEDLRRSILKSRIEAAQTRHEGFTVPDSVIGELARSITSNGRDLDGAVNRLLAHAMLTDAPITMETAEQAIRDLIRNTDTRRVKIEDIQRIVAQHYNVSRADLLSARRTATVVKPRQVAIYLSKILTLRSLPEIGRRFGGRDHNRAACRAENRRPHRPRRHALQRNRAPQAHVAKRLMQSDGTDKKNLFRLLPFKSDQTI